MPELAVDVIDIDDPADPRVDDFRDLSSVDRRPDLPTLPGGRPGKALVVAEGVLVAQRMIASRFAPHAFLGVGKRLDELDTDLRSGALAGVPFYRATADVMAEVVGFHLNRGVLAVARRAPVLSVDAALESARSVVILEGVNDHENIGSIFRNAAGLGVDAVLFGAGCADPLYRRCVRVSMGHALLVPFAQFDEWPSGLDAVRDQGFRLVSLTPDPAAVTLADAVRTEKVGFLVGAEGPGLTASAMAATDVRARIPMSRGTDSLNVATAAAIAFYERVRSGTMEG
ncbi:MULTISPECIES: RNA methyltransferase [unclassified Gordonia (in: high G+C Gram-positive bacteria)]|uniref:TrmH family RNA methyltransferase n=1 Tax=unclassified Gordonia (in: high G+C Gram-positive bacteria) TaxID=2657482 RepID=UPI001F0E3043|nr:RNA methyltransferase [Gordonia sp. ABSL49_1]MCH5643180.1 RNA methyltransferase [Gordonia sp. ABSL49_1]